MEIDVSSQEVASGAMTPAKVQQAADAILQDGYVILNNVVAHDHLDRIKEKMEQELLKYKGTDDSKKMKSLDLKLKGSQNPAFGNFRAGSQS